MVLKPKATTFTQIQAGVGNLDHVIDESNQSLESATDGGTDTADTSADAPDAPGDDPDDTASDDMASDDETDDNTDDSLSDTDWKEVLLTAIDATDGPIHPDDLQQAVMDHYNKDPDAASGLIGDALDEGYLQTTVDMNLTATHRLEGAADAQTDESG